MMQSRPFLSRPAMLCLAGLLPATPLPATDVFDNTILPILTKHCISCHSTEKQKGDLDLESISSRQAVRQHAKIWQNVLTQIAEGEMPPKDETPLTAFEKSAVLTWLRSTLNTLALERAGDPGPVILRRLSNAEYAYTIQDLTGLDTLDPAREFPVDGAAGEGFTNTGQSLVISPTLVTKYLDAAKEIASHAILTPRGIRFSPHTTRRDWTEESLAEIRAFYQSYSTPAGGDFVTRQGIPLDQTRGGRLPLEQYFAASLEVRDNNIPIAEAAARHGVIAKYLTTLLAALTEPNPSVILKPIQARWRKTTLDSIPALVSAIGTWQEALWKFSSVGHIGKIGGPKAWMETVDPLTARQEFRLKLDSPFEGDEVILYLTSHTAGDGSTGDAVIWHQPQLQYKDGPPVLLRDLRTMTLAGPDKFKSGLNPDSFDAQGNLRLTAPGRLSISIPADLAIGATFATTGSLDLEAGQEGSVQLQVARDSGPGIETKSEGIIPTLPVLTHPGSEQEKRWLAGFAGFRRIFPAALCYSRIVPVDEVVTLTLFHREDEPLRRLLLDDAKSAELDRMWDELHFVSQDALTLVDAFEQLWQYATQDADPAAFTPLREPIRQRAEQFRQTLIRTAPVHIQAVLDFAGQAWRRPLTEWETLELRDLYQTLRQQELPHEEAVRLLLVRVLVAPLFLYKAETPGPGTAPGPLSDQELAVRLSYFLWSSQPDAALRAAAEAGTLHWPEVLQAHTRRMLADDRTRRLATEFGCAWLHIHGLDELDEKSERHFPTFHALRNEMYEETRQFLTDFLRNNGSITGLLTADHTFLNEAMAKHYGIPGITGPAWRRVDGMTAWHRGGLAGQASILTKQSGASRTSPILRGNWVAEVLLGDKLPRPPKDVPQLPEDESNDTLTVRQLTEKHSSDPRCAKCHVRIDAFGFSLEHYDAIGRYRETDAAGRPIDSRSTVQDGTPLDGLRGLQHYLSGSRQDDFVRQFCRKLLGYALGRSVQLSDQPLLDRMVQDLPAGNFQVHSAIEMIILSPQFREIRGRDTPSDD